MNTILLLEDEPTLNEIMCDFLKDEGYKVTSCASYEEALELAVNGYDLFIFDVKIIGGNGFELLKDLRQSGIKTPCIFTTSLNTIDDVKSGFDSGCDDYLKKPFELAELLVRVQNLLKREFGASIININKRFSFDALQKRVINDGNIINIAKKECDLLALLIQNAGKVVTRDEIYSHLWGFDEPSEMSLRVYIRNLRKLIGEAHIIAHPKVGYEFKNEAQLKESKNA